ncbi:MAG: hypothetical protein LBR53_06140 [Deltaproteobacteria bacterium]|nr:hypothetical protein [Deltaproteobacteria bacterium]
MKKNIVETLRKTGSWFPEAMSAPSFGPPGPVGGNRGRKRSTNPIDRRRVFKTEVPALKI